jgi:hypothetical protein
MTDEKQTHEEEVRNDPQSMVVGIHVRGGTPSAVVWGLFLIALGGAFMLDRLGVLSLPPLWQFWPVVLVVIAISNVIQKQLGSAVMFLILFGWFQSVQLGWHGLTYSNSWPLAVIAAGAGIVIGALTGEQAMRIERRRHRFDRMRERLRREMGHE